ncbi:hypothetical protein HHK36_014363 [Tetracentron sinense]|uniref:RING-type domain-containing protein n=1 Tax=Tetracentron sinense TaxID=13715 RepID=A0A834Z5Y4_TETSI|nr:hypothetical protein HHK36_014363 [Tetracentron sinense]
MDHALNHFMASPPHPTTSRKPSLSFFYYGLVVMGSIAVVLTLYNIIFVGWCTHRRSNRRSNQSPGDTSLTFVNSDDHPVSTFKFQKEVETPEQDNECAVCLSVFEDDEDVRQLPRCNHSFHAPCIDMWLYSHSDCPLCRAIVELPAPHELVLV